MKILTAVALFALVPISVSCGGDDGGPTSTDAEFCEFIRDFDELDPETDLDQAIAAIDMITQRAPNAELRKALEDLRPVFVKIAEFDMNDQTAITEMMTMLMDPKVIAAGQVLDTYGKDVCGLDETSDTSPSDTAGA